MCIVCLFISLRDIHSKILQSYSFLLNRQNKKQVHDKKKGHLANFPRFSLPCLSADMNYRKIYVHLQPKKLLPEKMRTLINCLPVLSITVCFLCLFRSKRNKRYPFSGGKYR